MFAAALTLALPLLAAAAPIAQRASGARGTYYDTSVGLGACGLLHQNDEYTVAMNSAQFDTGSGYPSSECGKSIWISYGGKTVTATIQDECPSCPYNGLDLSEGLFSALANKDLGVISLDWGYSDSSSTPETTAAAEPTSTYVAPTSTYVAPEPTTTEVAVTVAVEPTTTEAAAAAATTSVELACEADTLALYAANATAIYSETYFNETETGLVRLTNWAVKSDLLALLNSTTSVCYNGSIQAWNATSNATSLLEHFDF